MAKNYNPRFGSSASRNSNASGRRKASASSKRGNAQNSSSFSSRNKVEYIQSAKTDLAAKTPENDARASYARFRSDKTIRVLGNPESSTQRSRHQINASFEEDQGRSERRTVIPPVAGVTVREHRQRQRAAARRQSKAPARILLSLFALVVLAAIALGTYFSPAFSVNELTIEGAHRLTNERLTELAAIPAGSTLLRIDIEEVEKRLASDPWVGHVEVKRSFPATIILEVKERQIVAVAELSHASSSTRIDNWLISTDGMWLGSFETPGQPDEASDTVSSVSLLDGVLVTNAELSKIIHVKDASRSIVPTIGQTVTDEGLVNALALINGCSPGMLELISTISAPDRINTTLTLTNHVGVAFGAAEDIQAKEQAIQRLLSEHEGLITYINVRVADRATYRAAG